jgi:c-di-GMP-binding flagellar brake protein YcgR
VLSLGSPVELEVANGDVLAVLEGVVVLTSAERIALQCPLSRKAAVTVEPGFVVGVQACAGSTITTFETTVVAVTREPGLLVIAVEPPESVEEERREFYRLSHRIPVDVRPDGAGTAVAGHSVDFGGGGIAILCGTPLAKGTSVALRLHLDGEPALDLTGTVVRLNEIPDQETVTYRLGIAFGRLEAQDERRLIQFIFAKQRAYRRKGLL